MFLRDEHLLEHVVAATCVRCRCPTRIREEWHLNSLYRFSTCDACGREESALVKRI